MKPLILTIEHPYGERNQESLFSAAGDVSLTNALDAATDRLEAVVAGLRNLMTVSECSNEATLICFAAESALALVYAGHAGVEAASRAPRNAIPANRGADSGSGQ